MVRCPACGDDNPDRARFCLLCGRPLDAAWPAHAREERKVVTVLFCDLVGSTARADGADPEDVQAALRPYHARLRSEIERFGGTVEKFIGDAVMAVFGAPTTHEDDAERAVRSALRVLDAIGELNSERGLGLAVRVGIATGEAVVALTARPERGEGMVAGDVVNTAARLQTVAPVGGIVVGEVTHRLTRNAFDYTELDAVSVKGKSQLIPIWQPTAARSRFGTDVGGRRSSPFIGRAVELDALRHAYARTARESSVQLVTVTGEPGVGKSRLLSEFFAWTDAQPELVRWRQGRCLPYGESMTFWALGEIVKAEAGILDSDGEAVAAAKLTAAVDSAVETADERTWVRDRLAPLVGLAQPDRGSSAQQDEAFAAWQCFLDGVAARTRLVLVVEDLHWADPALLAFLDHLVEWSAGVPLLVVVTARPELYVQTPGWGGGKRNSTTLALTPLSDSDTARLLGALLETAVLPAETQAALLERAGGNPLYAEEFVRLLNDRGLLRRRGSVVELALDADLPPPDSIAALVAARLDTLGPGPKALLADAAVVGKVFWSGALVALGATSEADVKARLHELARAEFVRPVRSSSVAGSAEYAFWHVLVRDIAYGQLPRALRATRHAAVADWIAGLAADRVADSAEVLAHHYGTAVELFAAAGDAGAVERLRSTTVRFLTLAGNRLRYLDPRAAKVHFQRAVELLAGDAPERGELLRLAASAANVSGQYDETVRLLEESLAVCTASGDDIGAGRALIDTASVRGALEGEPAASVQLLLEAVALLERHPESSALADAYGELAVNVAILGRADEAVRWGDAAVEVSERFGDDQQRTYALGSRGTARCIAGDGRALSDLAECIRLAREMEIAPAVCSASANRGEALWVHEDPRQSLAAYEEAAEFARRRGLSTWATFLTAMSLQPMHLLGRWDEQLERAASVTGSATPVRGFYATLTETLSVLVQLHRGAVGPAAASMARLVPMARELGDPQTVVPVYTVAALAELRQQRPDRVAGLLRELAAVVAPTPPWFRAQQLPDLSRLCVAVGDLALAEQLMRGLSETAAFHRHATATARAVLAEARGETATAAGLYAVASRGWREYGHVFEQAQADLGSGRCLARLGEAADTDLLAARQLFDQLEARPLLEEVDFWLRRTTAVSS